MRKMIKNVDAAVRTWGEAHAPGNGWRVGTHCYPTALAVKHLSGPEVFKRDDKSGAYTEHERWAIAHVGVYTVVTAFDAAGKARQAADYMTPLTELQQSIEDVAMVVFLGTGGDDRYTLELLEETLGVVTDTARCVMAAWWTMTATHRDIDKYPFIQKLVQLCNWRPGHRVPVGIGDVNADLSRPLPLIID